MGSTQSTWGIYLERPLQSAIINSTPAEAYSKSGISRRFIPATEDLTSYSDPNFLSLSYS